MAFIDQKLELLSEGKAQGIQYSKMTAVLLEAIKEQQIQIDELKSKLN